MKKPEIPECAASSHMQKMIMEKIRIIGTTTVGPKWQILIPKAAREITGIKPGDNLMMIVKHDRLIGLVRMDDINEFMAMMENELAEIRKNLGL